MMSSRKRKRLDDDIDALLLSSNAFKRKNKKREKRLEAFGSIPTRCAGTERSHNSFLLALKSRAIVVSKERRRKAKTLGLLALQKSYLFRCFFALRARQPFRHQSSQHFLLSLSLIFLVWNVFVSKRKAIDFLFIFSFIHPFSGRCLFGFFILCRASSLSLSLSLSLSIRYTYKYTRRS